MDLNPTNFDPNYELANLDPREAFPASAEEAEDHHEWAKLHGKADSDIDFPIPDDDIMNFDDGCDGPCYDGDTGNRWA